MAMATSKDTGGGGLASEAIEGAIENPSGESLLTSCLSIRRFNPGGLTECQLQHMIDGLFDRQRQDGQKQGRKSGPWTSPGHSQVTSRCIKRDAGELEPGEIDESAEVDFYASDREKMNMARKRRSSGNKAEPVVAKSWIERAKEMSSANNS